MKILKAIFILIFILQGNCAYSQYGWIHEYSGTGGLLTDIVFTNENTGWVLGLSGLIIKTTDGGITWQGQYTQYHDDYISAYFMNSNTGFLVGDMGYVYKTTNGGLNWSSTYLSHHIFFQSIVFTDLNTGFCGGIFSHFLYKTTNAGVNWDSITIGQSQYILDIKFVNNNIGYILNSSDTLKKSTNGGLNWSPIYAFNYAVGGLQFFDEQNGFANCSTPVDSGSSMLMRTTNGGVNWFTVDSSHTLNMISFTFRNENTGYATFNTISENLIKKTTDGGHTWVSQYPSVNRTLRCIFFMNDMTGWVGGDFEQIYKTTNGGEPLGIHELSNEESANYSLSQNFPNPFNPSTKIEFSISKNNEFVRLTIYDVTGKQVEKLVEQQMNSGSYFVDFNGDKFASGIYYYMLESNGFKETKKMVLIK